MASNLISFESTALTKRGITEETCHKYGYGIGEMGGEPVQVATYCDKDGAPVAQKIRSPDKKFFILGDIKLGGLYGQHLFADKGRMVTITEGEIDALSVSQAQGNKWPVVSLPNGAAGAEAAIKRSLEWLMGFETIVLMFDMDSPGQTAAVKVAELFPPGKCRIARLPLKDANEMLVAKRVDELINAMWQAKPFRPDGILDMEEVISRIQASPIQKKIGEFHLLPRLQTMLRGIAPSEIVTICAGTGVGKSEIARSMAYDLIQQGCKIGYVALEEGVERAALGLAGYAIGERIHLLDEPLKHPKTLSTLESFKDKVFFYNHFGSTDPDNLINRMRYMRVSLGVDAVVFDHLSIVISGSKSDNDNKAIEQTMTAIRTMTQETGLGIIMVSHLSRKEGTPHEEGGVVSINQLRGSHSIGQLSDIIIAGERNQQAEEDSDVTTLRILKNRRVGLLGIAGYVKFDHHSGRFTETISPPSKKVKRGKAENHGF